MFRQWGADVINMTTVPEVVLAKEAGLCYASIAMATDYDCWKEHEEAVSGKQEAGTPVFFFRPYVLISYISLVNIIFLIIYLLQADEKVSSSLRFCEYLVNKFLIMPSARRLHFGDFRQRGWKVGGLLVLEMTQRNFCTPCS